MAKSKRTAVRLTLQQAKLILLAKAVEESNDAHIKWTSADAEAASLRAAHTVGESADAVKLLTERAKVVLRTALTRPSALKLACPNSSHLSLFFWPSYSAP